jgi:hypothetical protein
MTASPLASAAIGNPAAAFIILNNEFLIQIPEAWVVMDTNPNRVMPDR